MKAGIGIRSSPRAIVRRHGLGVKEPISSEEIVPRGDVPVHFAPPC